MAKVCRVADVNYLPERNEKLSKTEKDTMDVEEDPVAYEEIIKVIFKHMRLNKKRL